MWQPLTLTATCLLGCLGLTATMPAAQADDAAAKAVAAIEKQGDTVQAVTLKNDQGELRFYRSVWQAVSVTTASGKKLNITDPLFYNTQVDDKPAGQDAYWTKPESWDAQLRFEIIDRTADVKEGPVPATLRIEGRRPGVVKTVHLTQYPGEAVVYVVSQVKAEADSRIHDPQLIYLARAKDNTMHLSEMTLDGVMVDADSKATGQRGAFMYLGTSDTSLGVAVAPAKVQRVKVRDILHHLPQKTGRELRILGVAGQPMKAGETVEFRFALHWGDGHQLREVTALIDAVADGQHNDRFYPAATPR